MFCIVFITDVQYPKRMSARWCGLENIATSVPPKRIRNKGKIPKGKENLDISQLTNHEQTQAQGNNLTLGFFN